MVLKYVVFSFLIAWSLGAIFPANEERTASNLPPKAFSRKSEGFKFNKDDSDVENNVFFYLYTREYSQAYQITKNDTELLQNSTFDISRPTKVLIHGFMNSYMNDMEQTILEAYLYNQDVNVIAVDWQKLAGSLLHYDRAASYTLPVGKQVAQLIDFLVTAGNADISSFHLIGHSLGSHVASFASNYVTSGNITRISGLDPALPNFSDASTDGRLDPSDADLVDCIHTCGGLYGFYTPLCDIDFYPNGGIPVQPGCWLLHLVGVCSHGRAYSLFAASINTTFQAQYCESFSEVESSKCTGNLTGLMGDPAPETSPGLYYLKTSGEYPYWTSSS